MNSGYTLDKQETVIKEVGRHWIDLVPVTVSSGVLLIMALVLTYIAARFSSNLSSIPTGFISLIVLILLLLAAAIFGVGLFVFHQNKLIITDKHIIQIHQRGLFSRSVSQLSMAKVQDVNAKREGVIATLLNYGSIEIETAGEDDIFVFNVAARPQELADECMSIHEKYPGSTTPPSLSDPDL